MDIWNSIVDFTSKNWDNILVSIITGILFFVLGPLGLWFSNKKIRKEKIVKAKEQLLDLIESMLVSNESITSRKLTNVFYAIGRQNSINLEFETDLNNILEDLILRFASSKHLSATQKDEYIKRVHEILDELSKAEKAAINEESEKPKVIPKSYKRLIEEIESKVSSNELENIKSSIDELKEKLSSTPVDSPLVRIFSIYAKVYKRSPLVFIIAIIITIALYVWLIWSFLK